MYKIRGEGGEGGATPALEGVVERVAHDGDPWSRSDRAARGKSDLDYGETQFITNASWDSPVPRQSGTKVTLRIKIVEDDTTGDDDMGDKRKLNHDGNP